MYLGLLSPPTLNTAEVIQTFVELLWMMITFRFRVVLFMCPVYKLNHADHLIQVFVINIFVITCVRFVHLLIFS